MRRMSLAAHIAVLLVAAFPMAACGGPDGTTADGTTADGTTADETTADGPTSSGNESDTSYVLPGASMEPTLAGGSRFLATKVGDDYMPTSRTVVVYRPPEAWGLDAIGIELLVHRVIGMPGDTIKCCDRNGLLSVDGVPLVEDYIAAQPNCNGPMVNACRRNWSVDVPDDHVFVMGDNRAAAADSSQQICASPAPACRGTGNRPFVPITNVVAVVNDP